MRLKTFTAPSMSEAMDLVRQEMGDDAIIVSTQKATDGLSCRVTAAIEEEHMPDDGAAAPLRVETVPDPIADIPERDAFLRQILTAHGLPAHVVEPLLRAAASDDSDPVLALASAIDALIRFAPIDPGGESGPLVLTGVPGAGKTITVAKLAAQAKMAGRRVCVATTDAKRAGGVEQLKAFTRILDIDLIEARDGDEIAAHVADIENAEFTVIDTAGVNPFDDDAMTELRRIAAACNGEPVLVLPAGGDAMESADTAAAFAGVGCTRMIVTRLDMTRRLGGILTAAIAGRLAIANVSINPQVADGLSRLNPVSLARLIVPEDEPDEPPARTKVAQ